MGKVRGDPLKTVTFHCAGCGHRFEAEPDSISSAPHLEHHPWEYAAQCSGCGEQAVQIWWEKNLMKAHAEATGPKTEEGVLRCRFNALKHGLFAKTAHYYPAKPGSYPHCERCEYLTEQDCVTVGGCLKRADIFLRHQMAFEAGDPKLLLSFRSSTQAALQALIDDMILAIAQDGGPRIKTVEWYYDKEGCFHLARFKDEYGIEQQIYKLESHPLLKPLMDFISKNKMTLEDMGMTPKVQDEHDLLEGHFAGQEQDRETMLEFQQRNAALLEDLSGMIERSRQQLKHDPVLIEHGEAEVVDGGG